MPNPTVIAVTQTATRSAPDMVIPSRKSSGDMPLKNMKFMNKITNGTRASLVGPPAGDDLSSDHDIDPIDNMHTPLVRVDRRRDENGWL